MGELKLSSKLSRLSKKFPRAEWIVFLLLIFLFFLFFSQKASAALIVNDNSGVFKYGTEGAGFIEGTVGNIVLAVASILAYFCKLFVNLGANFLDTMLNADIYNFANERMIQDGWKLSRDICNMLFLLALLFIAFCTILRIEKYHAKKTLLTLIIMALLINFSKPIAIFIFDGSQLLMNYFLDYTKDASKTIANISKIADLVYGNNPGFLEWAFSNNSVRLAVRALFNTFFLFMLGVSIFSMALFLLIRIVAIWIIIIVSPFAFFASVIPDFSKISSSWWDALFKYSYIGPAMAFFIWLISKLLSSSFIAKIENKSDSVFTMKYFISYAVTVAFLYASILAANKFGIQFASAITGTADRAIKWGAGILSGYRAGRWAARKGWAGAKAGAKRGADWFGYSVMGKWDPRAWKQAWDKRSAEVKEQKLGDSVAQIQETLSRTFKTGQKPPDYYTLKRRAENVAKYRREQELMGTTDNICNAGIRALEGRTDREAQERTIAYLQTLEDGRNLNEYVKKELGQDMSSEDLKRHLYDLLRKRGIGEQEALLEMEKFSDQAWGKGDYHLFGMTRRNADGTLRLTTEGEQAEDVRGKLQNANIQHLMINFHPEATLRVDKDGNPIGINGLVGEAFHDIIVRARGKHLNRCRPDAINKNLLVADELRRAGWGDFIDLFEQEYKRQAQAGAGQSAQQAAPPPTPPPQPSPPEPPRIFPGTASRARSRTRYNEQGNPIDEEGNPIT